MRCYSPKPLEAYAVHGDALTYTPAAKVGEWNLIWLSLPEVDYLAEPEATIFGVRERINFSLVGAMQGLTRCRLSDGRLVTDMMGDSALAFAQDFQDAYQPRVAPTLWTALGGQRWMDTMTARAYEADGLKDVYEASLHASNVIVANFRAKRASA